PELDGADIRRAVLDKLRADHRTLARQHHLLAVVAVSDRALIQRSHHTLVSLGFTYPERTAKSLVLHLPAPDGAGGHLEEIGQVAIGCPELAQLARLACEPGLVFGRPGHQSALGPYAIVGGPSCRQSQMYQAWLKDGAAFGFPLASANQMI